MWQDELRTMFAQYVETKQRYHVLDYDDLLLYWAHMMLEPSIAGEISERFDHVLVDEYQDTNRLQASVLLALRPNGNGMTVVGDDAQSIYSFRAATVRNILDFPAHFNPRAEIVTLEQNYRSTQPILSAANAVIELAEERFTKNLWSERKSAERPQLVSVRDEADQALYVVEKVLESREQGLDLKAQAVLFRASHHSGQLEVELTRRNIPFVKFGGLKFLEGAHIKDVLAFLRWAENPRDRVAGFRVIQLLPGAGPATAARVLERVAERADPADALAISSLRRRRSSTGRLSLRPFVWSAAARRAGPPSSTWCAAGTSRTSIVSTKMRCCARPIFCNSSRSPRPTRAESGF
jgi:DNA helicase II / ATP-dependent DNA helicase PcrA